MEIVGKDVDERPKVGDAGGVLEVVEAEDWQRVVGYCTRLGMPSASGRDQEERLLESCGGMET